MGKLCLHRKELIWSHHAAWIAEFANCKLRYFKGKIQVGDGPYM